MKHHAMAIMALMLLAITANADDAALDYVYAPLTIPGERPARVSRCLDAIQEGQLDNAFKRCNDLLDRNLDLTDAAPLEYGQLLANVGMILAAQGAYENAVINLEGAFEFVEAGSSRFDPVLINVAMALGIAQLSASRLEDAESSFRRAQNIMHRLHGVYTIEQTQALEYLKRTYLRQQDIRAADTQQLFNVRVNEQSYGDNSEALIPVLVRTGYYFSQRGEILQAFLPPSGLRTTQEVIRDSDDSRQDYIALPPRGISTYAAGYSHTDQLTIDRLRFFQQSIDYYERAIGIIEDNYGVNDIRLVTPLRALARTRFLQNRHSQKSRKLLERAVAIVDSDPNSDISDKARVRVWLGDLYTLSADPRATPAYSAAWQLLVAEGGDEDQAYQYFSAPQRLFPDHASMTYLDRVPDAAQDNPGVTIFVEIGYTVDADGTVSNVRLLDKNAPNREYQVQRDILARSVFRPRMVNGIPVATENMVFRHIFLHPESPGT